MWSDRTGDISNMTGGFIYMSSTLEDKYLIEFYSSYIRENTARAANGFTVRSSYYYKI